MRWTRFIVGGAALASTACSILLGWDGYDRDYGAAADAAPEAAFDAGTSNGDGGDAESGSAPACVPIAEPTCPAGTDTQADPVNCGACGHACSNAGAKCNLGVCDPQLLFLWISVVPTGIAVDDNYYYAVGTAGFGYEGGVGRGPKSGGGEIVAAYSADPRRVLVKGTELYWTERDGIAHAPSAPLPDGGLRAADTVVANQVSPKNLVADADHLYWTNAPAGGDVWRASIATPTDARPIAAGPNAYGVAVDASHVYWSIHAQDGPIWRANKDGSAAMVIADKQSFPADLYVDDEAVYWANSSESGAIMRLAKGDTVARPLVTGRNKPSRVVARGGYVYWYENGVTKQDILRVSRCGGVPLRIAANQDVTDLAVDDKHVFWTTGAVVDSVAR